MENEYLATYLNDHLAGSVAALELLEDLEANAGDGDKKFFAEVRGEIAADQQQLETLMNRLQVRQRVARKAAAWLTEKLAHIKLLLDDRSAGPLWRLEALEALSLGIEGKLAFWRALGSAETKPERFDFERLTERAVDQRRRVEAARLEAAKAALTSPD